MRGGCFYCGSHKDWPLALGSSAAGSPCCRMNVLAVLNGWVEGWMDTLGRSAEGDTGSSPVRSKSLQNLSPACLRASCERAWSWAGAGGEMLCVQVHTLHQLLTWNHAGWLPPEEI